MPGPSYRPRRLAALAAALLLAACTDAPEPTAPRGPDNPAGDELARIRCSVDVASSTMSCEDESASAAASATLILGGQGRYVRLASENVVRAGDTLRADVTVQNLTYQAMGTPDGTTATGLRVFFHDGPTVTGGTGAVAVANADGLATFTASAQPYFQYSELLPPVATSAPRTWRFDIDPGVTSFFFVVYVSAELPAEQSILRWEQQRGRLTTQPVLRAWGTSDDDVFAVGHYGGFYHYDGTAWRRMHWSGSTSDVFFDVDGITSETIFAVGGVLPASDPSALIARYTSDGWVETWSGVANEMLRGVWTHSDSLAYAVGTGGIIVRWDGTGWGVVSSPTTATLYGVWGSSPDDVWAAGEAGTVLHWDGATWNVEDSGSSEILWGVRGDGSGSVWFAANSGEVIRYSATGWSTETAAAVPLYRLAIDESGSVLAVGEDGVLIRRPVGGTWTPVPTGTTDALYGLWFAPSGALFVVGDNGLLASGTVDGVSVSGGQARSECLLDIWGRSPDDVYAVGHSGTILHYDGTDWTPMNSGTTQRLNGVWGLWAPFYSEPVYAVGDSGTVLEYDGATWSRIDDGSRSETLRAIWGRSASNVWARGDIRLTISRDGLFTYPDSAYDIGMNAQDFGEAFALTRTSTGSYAIERFHDIYWSGGLYPLLTATGMNAIWGAAADDIFVVGSGGQVARYQGSTWSTTSIDGGESLHDVWGSSATNVFAVGSGGIWHFDGTDWRRALERRIGVDRILTAVWGMEGHVFAVGCAGVIIHGRR